MHHSQISRGREWVGGCLFPSFFVTDRDEPYRPGLVIWMEADTGVVLANQVVAPEEIPGAVGRALASAFEEPMAGPPERPDRLRVGDPALLAELRGVLGDDTPIEVAATPELDELLQSMLESLAGDDDAGSYLDDGRVSEATVAGLFAAAGLLYRLAPWRVATDDQVLRVDIPALGVEGACLSIMGNLGEALGIVIFPSLAGFEAFAAMDLPAFGSGPLDFGTDWLVLSFERGADLPGTMRREVAEHTWPVEDANAFPRVARHESDGASRPLVERDLKIAAACATALCAFYVKHQDLFEVEVLDEPVCESFFDRDDLEVRFTAPYEALPLFEVDARQSLPATPRVGRNDPCPCGSGKKYKKCHLEADRQERGRLERGTALGRIDTEITLELFRFGLSCFGEDWKDAALEPFADPGEVLQLAVPMAVYHAPVEGRSVAEWFLAKGGSRLSADERACLEAECQSWLSLWEVEDARPGDGLTLRDCLSGQCWEVVERTASETLSVHDRILARLVDIEGHRSINGLYPRSLAPSVADEVERKARGHLRRKRDVPTERLREPKFCRYLVRRVEEELFRLDAAPLARALHNRDGDSFLFTTDHFAFEPAVQRAVEQGLAGIPGVEAPEPDAELREYLFVGDDSTLLGVARVTAGLLRLETNSVARADDLRERVEQVCQSLVRHRAREHADPLSEVHDLDG